MIETNPPKGISALLPSATLHFRSRQDMVRFQHKVPVATVVSYETGGHTVYARRMDARIENYLWRTLLKVKTNAHMHTQTSLPRPAHDLGSTVYVVVPHQDYYRVEEACVIELIYQRCPSGGTPRLMYSLKGVPQLREEGEIYTDQRRAYEVMLASILGRMNAMHGLDFSYSGVTIDGYDEPATE